MHDPSPAADRLARAVIDASETVHRSLGPGFLEAVYEEALCVELRFMKLVHERQVAAQTKYRGEVVGLHRMDLVVGGLVLVELKAVEALNPIHTAQVISYLRTARIELGLLINFNVRALRMGVRRVVFTRHTLDP